MFGQQERPEHERNLSQEAMLALDLQRAKEAQKMGAALAITQALSMLISAHVSNALSRPGISVPEAEREAAKFIARALASI
jgi:hypothetical protein